jgi:hypothetical protein
MVFLGYMIPTNAKGQLFFDEESRNLEVSHERLLELIIEEWCKNH